MRPWGQMKERAEVMGKTATRVVWVVGGSVWQPGVYTLELLIGAQNKKERALSFIPCVPPLVTGLGIATIINNQPLAMEVGGALWYAEGIGLSYAKYVFGPRERMFPRIPNWRKFLF